MVLLFWFTVVVIAVVSFWLSMKDRWNTHRYQRSLNHGHRLAGSPRHLGTEANSPA